MAGKRKSWFVIERWEGVDFLWKVGWLFGAKSSCLEAASPSKALKNSQPKNLQFISNNKIIMQALHEYISNQRLNIQFAFLKHTT